MKNECCRNSDVLIDTKVSLNISQSNIKYVTHFGEKGKICQYFPTLIKNSERVICF